MQKEAVVTSNTVVLFNTGKINKPQLKGAQIQRQPLLVCVCAVLFCT